MNRSTLDAEMHLADWLVLVLVAFVSVVFALFSAYLISVRNSKFGNPVRFCNIPILVATMATSVVHMFSTLVANSHLRVLDFSCVFWTLWGQFVFGLGLRLVFITTRTATYFFILNRATSMRTHMRRHLATALIGVLVIAVPFALALVATLAEHTPLADDYILWRDSTGWCVLSWESKLVIVVWILAVFVCNIVAALVVRQKHTHTTANVRAIFKPVRDTLIIGLVIMVCELALVFGDFVRLWWGRTLFELLVVVLHVFTVARLVGKQAWKCYTRDRLYLREFEAIVMPRTQRIVSFDDLCLDPHALDTFMWWCVRESDDRLWMHHDERHNENHTVRPKNAYMCWRSCRLRVDATTTNVARPDGALNTHREEKALEIIDKHVGEGCDLPVVVPKWMRYTIVNAPDRARPEIFDDLCAYVVEAFKTRYWNTYQSTLTPDVIANLMYTQYTLATLGLLNQDALEQEVSSSDESLSSDNVFSGSTDRIIPITLIRDPSGDIRKTCIQRGDGEMNAGAFLDDEEARLEPLDSDDDDGNERAQPLEIFASMVFEQPESEQDQSDSDASSSSNYESMDEADARRSDVSSAPVQYVDDDDIFDLDTIPRSARVVMRQAPGMRVESLG